MSTRSKTPTPAIRAGIVLMRLAAQRDALAAKRDALDERIREQVTVVRDLGGTWTTVAVALNVTKQAAQQRYGV